MKPLFIFILTLMIIQENQAQDSIKFRHILITNDDGIEDKARLLKFAQSVKKIAHRASIVVPESDRSGTSNYTTYGKYKDTLEVTCLEHDPDKNIGIYTVPGNPADCILLGLHGLFGDEKPDLVLSGINSGSNTGPEWFGSGTIGAVRMAAYLGVKGIAFSGYNKNDELYNRMIMDWIVDLLSRDVTGHIRDKGFLTIAFPAGPADKVKGVKITGRRIAFDNPDVAGFKKIEGNNAGMPGNRTVWSMSFTGNPVSDPGEYDDVLLREGYIVITPMTIDENDNSVIEDLKKTDAIIPAFGSE